MIKKLTKTIVVGTLVMSLGIVNVFANSYKGYVLPARQGNNYTGAHSKTTTSNYITNKVTDEYSYAAEPPVQFRLSHLSRRSEPL